jgi:hypothetical protein
MVYDPAMTYTTLLLAALAFAGQHAHSSSGMDFDQEQTVHHFRLAEDGGAIEIDVRRAADTDLRDIVRMHLRHISQEFAAGNFDKPFATHGETPAGVPDMVRLKARITYSFEDMEHGGRVRIRAAGQEARDAVHAFLRYQIREHATGDSLTVKK